MKDLSFFDLGLLQEIAKNMMTATLYICSSFIKLPGDRVGIFFQNSIKTSKTYARLASVCMLGKLAYDLKKFLVSGFPPLPISNMRIAYLIFFPGPIVNY